MSRDPERAARAMLARHAVTTAPVEVEAIALAEDIDVVRCGSDGPELGFLLDDGELALIGINNRLRRSARRQRLTIAHELGHWKLHGSRPITIDHDVRLPNADTVPSAASLREEAEANAFAGELLMPAELVYAAVRREVGGASSRDVLVRKLAAEFGVSTDAMAWRLLNLGMLT